MTLQQFIDARFGLFVHYGLYSLLQRGEWVWNRETISRTEYPSLATRFRAENSDADALCRLARDAGMKYIVLTTMHHDGFRLYPTNLSDFHIGNSAAAGRDLVAEVIENLPDFASVVFEKERTCLSLLELRLHKGDTACPPAFYTTPGACAAMA